jgi:T5SS/PEP-CTERM-associated repeat protein
MARPVLRAALPAITAGLFWLSAAQAALNYSGDVSPANPSTWTSSTVAVIGNTGNGSLTINGGSSLAILAGEMGYSQGGNGTLTVDGSGSNWTGNALYMGYMGSGTLNITNGASVSTNHTSIGALAGSSGTVTVDGIGSTLTSSSELSVGGDSSSTGSLTVTNGASVSAGYGFIGFDGGSGVATINGAGSKMTISNDLSVGFNAAGTLNITNGASVSVTGGTTIGTQGTINFGANGGTLTTTGTLSIASSAQLLGSGTISSSGIVGDLNLVFNASHGVTQSIALNNGVTLNLSQSGSSGLGVGYYGSGTLTIADGVNVASSGGTLGYYAGSTGTATVTGAGSTWTNSGNLAVGNYGTGSLAIVNGGNVTTSGWLSVGASAGGSGSVTINGPGSTLNSGYITVSSGSLHITNGGSASSFQSTIGTNSSVMVDGAGSTFTNSDSIAVGYSGSGRMAITNGGSVSNTDGWIAELAGSNGSVTVDGIGSKWTNTAHLQVGYYPYNSQWGGQGTLSISDGGAVTAATAFVNSLSTLTADVGSSLTVGGGTGTLTSNGTIRLVAGASAANGTYTPISAGVWTNNGVIQALGGIWDATAHTVTVSSAVTTTAGTTATMDLYTNQRGLVTDPATGKSVGLGFQAAATPGSNLSFSAKAIGGAELSSLQSQVGAGNSVLSGWSFTTDSGYTSGTPVYLSLFAGSGYSLADLVIWKYNGSTWSQFAANDLAYNNIYASFTASDLSDYAVSDTTPTPIPPALLLFGSGLFGLAGIRRRAFTV